jgi:hypothetical protein
MVYYRNKINSLDFILSGSGVLIAGGQQGRVRYYISSSNSEPPVIGEVNGDQALLDAAWEANHAVLEGFGMKVRLQVTGVNTKNGGITFWAAPVLKALARVAKVSA